MVQHGFFWSLVGALTSFGGEHVVDNVTPTNIAAIAPKHTSHHWPISMVQTQNQSHWDGWSNINYWFAFGDSYSSTRFNTLGSQPNVNNPFGNPAFPGQSSCNGSNYIAELTAVYNQSSIMTYNLAFGGATVNRSRTRELFQVIPSGVQQVHDTWYGAYVNNSIHVRWTSSNTLFSLWFGINDIISTSGFYTADILPKVVSDYHGLLETLYANNARNFLVLNVPAIERSPAIVGFGFKKAGVIKEYIATFNGLLADMLAAFQTAHPDVKVFSVDANSLFRLALENPKAYPETAQIRNTTGVCRAYSSGTPTPDTFYQECGVPANQYFWHDGLHPSEPVHRLVARVVSDTLTAA